MRPRLILHNSTSADGAVAGFDVDMGLHYQLLGSYGAMAHLVGSNTAVQGLEVEGAESEPETDADMRPVEGRDDAPLWVFVDSRGALQDKLHNYRRFEHCRDVLVLVSESTPESYLDYLRERSYAFHRAGKERVDLHAGLEWLAEKYDVDAVISDSGGGLNAALLENDLVDEVSLLVWPTLVGAEPTRLVGPMPTTTRLELLAHSAVGDNGLWLRYDVVR